MIKNLYNELEELLKKDERFVSQEGKLMRNAVYEASNKMDEKLLELLMSKKAVKDVFFKDIKGILVFDKQAFNFAINNRELLPDSYTRFKQKIGLINSKETFLCANDDVVLSFPFKDCVLEFDSTDPDQKREEVYFNEVLAHDQIDHLFDKKVLCNAVRVDKNGEKKITEFSIDDNLLIKGNNLLAMYSLLPVYKEKIKLMYWDVLYNTDSDQVPYADSFRHSSWLTMMKNRLKVAKLLLKQDGVICIQCDDNEMAYLKVLMDEIFTRNNFVNCIAVKTSESSGVKMSHIEKKLPKIKEYLLVYKNGDICINPIKIPKLDFKEYTKYYSTIIENPEDPVNKWKLSKLNDYLEKHKEYNVNLNDEESVVKFKMENASKMVYRTNNPSLEKYDFKTKTEKVISPRGLEYVWWEGKQMLFLKDYIEEYLCDFWSDISTINLNKEGNVDLKNGKKPELLIQRVITMFSNENDIVLDAYFGSGTTGAVALKIKRKFIGIEQLNLHFEKSIKRIKGVIDGDQSAISKDVNWQGGGSFVYCELEKLNEKYIDSIKKAKTKKDVCEIAQNIFESGFVSCFANSDVVKEMCENVQDAELDDLKKVLIEILDKNQLYVNYSDMNDKDFNVSEDDKKFTNSFYEAK